MVSKLEPGFFEQSTVKVAQGLLGKLLVRQIDGKFWVGKIVETEAYLGKNDAASHAHSGQTIRNTPMFGPAGRTYVYFTYGMHWMLNVVTEDEGTAAAVLIRAIHPLAEESKIFHDEVSKMDLKKKGSGPARLTKWLAIDKSLNEINLFESQELFLTDDIKIANNSFHSDKILAKDIIAKPRIGVDFAGKDKEKPLRFYLKGNDYISKI